MAKSTARQGRPSKRAATRAFERAWALLGRLGTELAKARADESKRRRQLIAASGDEIARRQAQLDAATARAGRTAALLTELSEMIAADAREQARGAGSATDGSEQPAAPIAAAAAIPAPAPKRAVARRTGPPSAPTRRAPVKRPVTRAAAAAVPVKPRARAARPVATPQPGAVSPPASGPSRPTAGPRTRRSLQPEDGGSGQSDA